MFLSLRRFLARLLDYGLFYFFEVLLSLMLPFEFEEKFYLTLALAVPLFWAPLEALLIRKYGTTVGKKIFGIKVPGLSWAQSFKRAFFIGKRPGVVSSRNITFWRYLLALMIACSAGSVLFLGQDISDAAIHYEEQVVGTNWIQYVSDDGKFTVHFPKKPEVASKTYEIPNGEPLNLSEYKAEKEAAFSVSYLDLPKKWSIFSSATLLKGAMKVVHDHMPGAQLLEKKSVKHKNYPAMDFRMKEGDNEIEGRLILVGSTIYKLMVVYYPDTPRDQQHEMFVNSFDLKEEKKIFVKDS
jgi:hypothetical protein